MDRFVKKNFIFSQNLECHKQKFSKKKRKKLKNMKWNNIPAGINYWAGCDTMPTTKNEKIDDFKKNYKEKYND